MLPCDIPSLQTDTLSCGFGMGKLERLKEKRNLCLNPCTSQFSNVEEMGLFGSSIYGLFTLLVSSLSPTPINA